MQGSPKVEIVTTTLKDGQTLKYEKVCYSNRQEFIEAVKYMGDTWDCWDGHAHVFLRFLDEREETNP